MVSCLSACDGALIATTDGREQACSTTSRLLLLQGEGMAGRRPRWKLVAARCSRLVPPAPSGSICRRPSASPRPASNAATAYLKRSLTEGLRGAVSVQRRAVSCPEEGRRKGWASGKGRTGVKKVGGRARQGRGVDGASATEGTDGCFSWEVSSRRRRRATWIYERSRSEGGGVERELGRPPWTSRGGSRARRGPASSLRRSPSRAAVPSNNAVTSASLGSSSCPAPSLSCT